jgi:hypothetical protein
MDINRISGLRERLEPPFAVLVSIPIIRERH